MPPDRTKKGIETRKTAERKALAKRIEIEGVEMSPCTHCEKHGRKCIVSPDDDKSRCSKSLEREEERIRSARQAAVELIAVTSACLARLEKQQEFLRKRGRDMLRRGLSTLDELDEAEEAERQASASSAASSAPTSELPEFDAFSGLSQSFWDHPSLGAVDGILPLNHG
ncbi:hypothetical protein V493_00105 [Pseudogymnoascus sp. VKM F-4281 (FW-2241)]|nr:hypothetical protein V493_00105 [Pseudogymnoascus sp. VKM F-4281 (FW-2241)]